MITTNLALILTTSTPHSCVLFLVGLESRRHLGPWPAERTDFDESHMAYAWLHIQYDFTY